MATAAPQSGRFCDSGRHMMDPNWETCPYCEAENKSKERTLREAYVMPSSASSGERRTTIGDAYADPRRETKVMPSAGISGPAVPAGKGDTRRIVGAIITYTWKPEGQLFEIRAGRNTLGAGRVGSTPGEPNCEILIPNDPKMSSFHALILCQAGHYYLLDQQTTNGTILNGQLLPPLQGTELPNYSEIITGSTVWTFVSITPRESTVKIEQKPTAPQRDPSGDYDFDAPGSAEPATKKSPGSTNIG